MIRTHDRVVGGDPNAVRLSDRLGIPPTPAWMQRALCAQVDPDLWFPEKGGNVSAAIAVCRRCPVKAECLQYALDVGDDHGIYGGVVARKRRKMKRRAA